MKPITVEYIPKEIIQCRSVAREINFTSMEQLTNFRYGVQCTEFRVWVHSYKVVPVL
jgi:hypothetical protein